MALYPELKDEEAEQYCETIRQALEPLVGQDEETEQVTVTRFVAVVEYETLEGELMTCKITHPPMTRSDQIGLQVVQLMRSLVD
jgi:uncharacterized protein with ACT and thioredoxin-like domain